MVRIGVVASLAWVLAAGCDRNGDTGVEDPAAPAGEVLSVEGEVTATRDGEDGRHLELRSDVYADDVIATGDDGSVRIRLSHNRAVWELGADERRRVDESVAWRAAAGEDEAEPEKAPDERSVAAGRHAEAEAADTRATALKDEADVGTEAEAEAEVEAEVRAEPPPPPPRERPRRARRAAPRPQPEPEPPAEPMMEPTGGGEPTAEELGVARAMATADAAPPDEELSSIELQQRVIAGVRGYLRGCYEEVSETTEDRLAGRIEVAVRVGRDGRIDELDLEVERGDLPGVLACTQRALGAATIDTRGRSLRAEFTVSLP